MFVKPGAAMDLRYTENMAGKACGGRYLVICEAINRESRHHRCRPLTGAAGSRSTGVVAIDGTFDAGRRVATPRAAVVIACARTGGAPRPAGERLLPSPTT
jgi:hypothetical protein